MKKNIVVTSLLFLTLFTSSVYAKSSNWKVEARNENRKNLIQDLNQLKNRFARIINGVVTSITGSTLTISKDGKIYTVNTDGRTQFRRHFWGKSSFSEISVNDNLNVWGKFTDDTKTTILATFIRDLSIMKRRGVFFGIIKSKSSNSFVITTIQRGNQTVFFDTGTKFVNRKEQTMTFDQLNVGDRVRVKGLWDKTLSKITEVTQVKDFSQPPIPTKSVTPGFLK